jgi:hypothetical protein
LHRGVFTTATPFLQLDAHTHQHVWIYFKRVAVTTIVSTCVADLATFVAFAASAGLVLNSAAPMVNSNAASRTVAPTLSLLNVVVFMIVSFVWVCEVQLGLCCVVDE